VATPTLLGANRVVRALHLFRVARTVDGHDDGFDLPMSNASLRLVLMWMESDQFAEHIQRRDRLGWFYKQT
jgi:hypothetical protein